MTAFRSRVGPAWCLSACVVQDVGDVVVAVNDDHRGPELEGVLCDEPRAHLKVTNGIVLRIAADGLSRDEDDLVSKWLVVRVSVRGRGHCREYGALRWKI